MVAGICAKEMLMKAHGSTTWTMTSWMVAQTLMAKEERVAALSTQGTFIKVNGTMATVMAATLLYK
jgi:hypothetical protein